ncbi:MAG: reverse transcriptase domain-containing protein [Hyphomicrobiaceae bacterium]|jgi:RNA-directed DNA polymerase
MPVPDRPAEASAVLRLSGRPLQSADDVANYLGAPLGKMLWTLYRAPDDVRYRHFEIPKRSGGMRPIHAPIGLVRELQDRLHVDFKQHYRAHPNAHGFIDGRSVASNAAEHTARRWVLNIDLEDFFPTINFGRIRGLLMRPPFELGLAAAAVCAQIVTHRNGLPQGAPTSPVLSNFIAATLDRRLLRLARDHKLTYSRYADDITFSTDLPQFPPSIAVHEQIEGGGFRVAAGEALQQTIRACGFSINDKKVRIQGRGVHQSVTGLCVNTRVNVERQRIRRIRAMLHAWQKFGLAKAAAEHLNRYRGPGRRYLHENPGAAFRNIVYGHLSFVKMVRGPADPVYLKLCAKVLDLDPNPSKFIRQMVFGADDYDIFISHASEDRAAVARPIFEACERLGMKAFLDEEHIAWGETFTRKINVALGAARTVLAIVSSTSVTKDWPLTEVNTALALEVAGDKSVVPLIVGKPDLSRLPLIRGKDYLEWSGDPVQVARLLRESVARHSVDVKWRPSRPEPAAGSVPTVAAATARAQTPPERQRSWLQKVFRKPD